MSSEDMSSDLPGFVRELGLFERLAYVSRICDWGYLTNSLHIVSKVPLTEKLIRSALQRLLKMIPTLRYIIRETSPDDTHLEVPVFVEKSDTNIDFETLETPDWINTHLRENGTGFDTINGPLWRVKFLPNAPMQELDDDFPYGGVVIFSFLHCIIDGMSYQRLFGHFLDCLEAVTANTLDEPESFPSYPAMDSFLEIKPGRFDGFKIRLLIAALESPKGRRFMSWLNRNGYHHNYLSNHKLPIEEEPSTPQRRGLVPMVISREDTACIVRSAKARGATVHGVLWAAAAWAYARMCHGKSFPIHLKVNTFTPLNMRRFVKEINLNSYGMYVQDVVYNMKVNIHTENEEYERLWTMAQKCTKEVRKQIDEKTYLEFSKFMWVFLPVMEATKPSLQMMEECRPFKYCRDTLGEFYVTNMMRCDFLTREKDANFKLVGRFGGTDNTWVGSIVGNNLNTFNDQIYWSLLFDQHIIHQEMVVKYGKDIQEILRKMCGDTSV